VVVADVPLPGLAKRFDYQSFDSTTGRLYISHMHGDRLDVFDTRVGKLLASLEGFPGAEKIGTADPLVYDCDVVVPAAVGNQFTSKNAEQVRAKLIVEGANGPTTPEADEVFNRKGIFLVPDILANAGGVTVSYFEWVQDLQSFFWSEHEVNEKLHAIMSRAFKEVLETSLERKVPMRMAAYCKAVGRVASATRERGIYP